MNGGSRFRLRFPRYADKSLIRRALEKLFEDVEHFIRSIVVKPVARALDLDQFGLLEVRDHAGRRGIGQKTFAAADQERRTPDA